MPNALYPDRASISKARALAETLPTGELHIKGTAVPLPTAAAEMLREILARMAAGEPVALVTSSSEMTPTEAAEFLNVSRGFIAKLMDDGTLPFRQVGAHRRIPGAAVAAYKAVQERSGRAAMDELVRLSQEMGGYDEEPPIPSKRQYRKPGGSGR